MLFEGRTQLTATLRIKSSLAIWWSTAQLSNGNRYLDREPE